MQSAAFTLSRPSLPLHSHKPRFKHSLHFDPIRFSTSSSKPSETFTSNGASSSFTRWSWSLPSSSLFKFRPCPSLPPSSDPFQPRAASVPDSVGDKTLELGALFGLWYLFNIYFSIYNKQSSYGFVDYFDCRSAALAIVTLNGRHIFGQPIKVNWAYASSQRERWKMPVLA